MKEKKIYKIRRILDGKFSLGGSGPSVAFHDNGKIWNGIGPLRNHIALLSETLSHPAYKDKPHPYEGCEVVEIELVVANSIPAMEEVIGAFERKKEKEARRTRVVLH